MELTNSIKKPGFEWIYDLELVLRDLAYLPGVVDHRLCANPGTVPDSCRRYQTRAIQMLSTPLANPIDSKSIQDRSFTSFSSSPGVLSMKTIKVRSRSKDGRTESRLKWLGFEQHDPGTDLSGVGGKLGLQRDSRVD